MTVVNWLILVDKRSVRDGDTNAGSALTRLCVARMMRGKFSLEVTSLEISQRRM